MQARRSRAFSLVEVVIALGLISLLIGVVVWILSFGGRSTSRLTPQLALQQASRKAVVRFLREVQEGMEVVTPRPGSTLSYALVRDKLSQVRWFYQLPQRTPNPRERLFELWRYVDDQTITDPEKRKELMLSNVKRLTFTSRGEGALQVNLLLAEGEQEYAMLTTVRLRNIASAEEIW
jgi:hypothetical protein